MAKQPRVWSGTQWEPLAVTLPDLSNYSTTTQMNTAISTASVETTLASGTLTAVSTLNLSSVFSDTYKFYRFYFTGYGTVSGAGLYFRFRENTTDKAATYYGGGNYSIYTGSVASYNAANNASQCILTNLNNVSTIRSSVNCVIYRTSTNIGNLNYQGYDQYLGASVSGGYENTSMTNFNGISIYPSSGTMTGSYVLTGIK